MSSTSALSTCSEDPFQAVRGPGCGSSSLSRGASVGRGGWRVGLRGEVWRRITPLYQHLGRTQQTDTVLTRQKDGLLHHLITHRATQLLLHTLHVGLERFKKRTECEESDSLKAESPESKTRIHCSLHSLQKCTLDV